MKKIILLILLVSIQINAKSPLTEIDKSEALIKVWGLMKYYHPDISKGEFNWNNEFIIQSMRLDKIKTQTELNEFLLNWINQYSFKELDPNVKVKENTQLFKKNIDFEWIERSRFSEDLREKLILLKSNYNINNHYASVAKLNSFVSFENEKSLENFNLENKHHRLLFLASYWNIMKYWNVNIYLTSQEWPVVLRDMLTSFVQADNKDKFEIARLNLYSKLNDSHANTPTSYLWSNILKFHPPFGGRLVNDTLVINRIYNSELAEKDNIQIGDLITKINGVKVKNHLESLKDLISASNDNYFKSWAEDQYILSNSIDSVQIEKLNSRNQVQSKFVRLYPYKMVNRFNIEKSFSNVKNELAKNWTILPGNIAYLNLEKSDKKVIDEMFDQIESTDGLILDLRNYPRNISTDDIPNHIYPQKDIFIKVLMPFLPSIGEYDGQSGLKLFRNPFKTGSNNRNYYDENIILLVDRNTVSQSEYLAMAIQNAPNCITLGEQTAGAVMNVIEVPMMDGTKSRFTGMGGFYPDNTRVQRNGLKIDYKVQENAFEYNPDKYIHRAQEILRENNAPNKGIR